MGALSYPVALVLVMGSGIPVFLLGCGTTSLTIRPFRVRTLLPIVCVTTWIVLVSLPLLFLAEGEMWRITDWTWLLETDDRLIVGSAAFVEWIGIGVAIRRRVMRRDRFRGMYWLAKMSVITCGSVVALGAATVMTIILFHDLLNDAILEIAPLCVVVGLIALSGSLWAFLPLVWLRSMREEYELQRCNVRCYECGYDLTGNTSGQCPECGVAAAALS